MNKFSTDNVNNIEDAEEINLREIVFKYLRYWRWFVLSTIVFLILGSVVYLRMDRKFSISTSVLLKENKGSGAQKNSPLGSLEELGLLSTTNNIDNEIAVFSSPNLMKQIVLALELQTSYFESGIFRDTEVYKDCPYYARLEDIKPDDLQGYIDVSLNKTGENGIAIEGKYLVKKEEIRIEGKIDKLPGFINLPAELGRLYITKRPEADKDKLNEKYYIKINNAQRVAYNLSEEIQVRSTTKSSSVLTINLDVLNVSKGIDILNEVVKIYNANNVQENNEMAVNTSNFINERLDSISIELSGIEDKVVNFKKEQGITDLSTEAKIFVEQTASVEQKRIETETQLKTVELIENFIHKSDNNYKLIPVLGITDIGLAEVITKYNESLLAYQRLERSASENNPARERALAELIGTRQSIQSAINNVKKALNISKSESDKQANQISSRIRSVPTQERGLLEVTRQQQVKQALYLYLMQVREETSITMASTSDKAKVITDPIIPDYPVSPKKNIIFLAAFLIGIIAPIIIIYVKDLLQLNISSREELEKLSNITVIGEIMKKEEEEIIVVRENRTTPIVELFRTLRNNVQFVLDEPEKKIILVTSTIPGEGKTFVSINLAASFALSDKKILLLGMDIRNPKLATDMNFPKSTGLTSYLSGSAQDWKTMLHKTKDLPNLDILQAGAIPPNPNELLMKPSLKRLIDEARTLYDIIIIDSAPIGVVSDTFLISSFANTTVYVTRENVTPKNAITFVNEVHHDKKLPNMYLVINGVEAVKNKGRHGRYGYGYTYGYGVKKES
ncbi:MAG: polysaccharide biosynthesis tyrosine autokinase [Prevotella sp.]|jgi:capsular exopolysaccharide synthesis family protein|nr:polysaccharide biosynthesis tyrosine autokinase [Prevotella sp.]